MGRWERVDGRKLPRYQSDKQPAPVCNPCPAEHVEDEFYQYETTWYLSVMHLSQIESCFGICLTSLGIV
jgi:hypothetical protein